MQLKNKKQLKKLQKQIAHAQDGYHDTIHRLQSNRDEIHDAKKWIKQETECFQKQSEKRWADIQGQMKAQDARHDMLRQRVEALESRQPSTLPQPRAISLPQGTQLSDEQEQRLAYLAQKHGWMRQKSAREGMVVHRGMAYRALIDFALDRYEDVHWEIEGNTREQADEIQRMMKERHGKEYTDAELLEKSVAFVYDAMKLGKLSGSRYANSA